MALKTLKNYQKRKRIYADFEIELKIFVVKSDVNSSWAVKTKENIQKNC